MRQLQLQLGDERSK